MMPAARRRAGWLDVDDDRARRRVIETQPALHVGCDVAQ
jgi:hypothetical protein